jgi:class 3 adenylate cyclase/streptogramin lyase
MRPRQERVLVAVLFTDIVGSSSILAELGDRRWRALLARHHALVRTELRRHGGREVDTAGDGFFAVFSDQGEAIRCACVITETVRQLGIEVRAGLTAGQVERSGRSYGGLAVHTGARIMAAAGPGEVLVSGVLRELVGGAGIAFADLGTRPLKGIPDDVHLYAVRAVDGVVRPPPLDADVAAGRRAAIESPPVIRRHPRLVLAALLALGAIAVTGVAVAVFSGGDSVQVRPASVLELNTDGTRVADVEVSDPTGTAPLRVPDGHELWTFSYTNRTVTCLAVNHDSVQVANVDSKLGGSTRNDLFGSGMAFSQGFGWVANSVDAVAQIDPPTCHTAHVYRVPGGASLMADVRGTLWVIAHDTGRIYTFDDSKQRFVVRWHPDLQDPRAMWYGEGYVWITDYGDVSVKRIDPTDGATRRIQLPPGTGPSGITVAFGYVWTANLGSGAGLNSTESVSRIDPNTLRVTTFHIGCGVTPDNSSDIVESPDRRTLWVTCPGKNSVVQIDPNGPRPHTIRRVSVGYVPRNMTAAYGHLWVVISGY